jgi:two-component system, sensor histidine kinase
METLSRLIDRRAAIAPETTCAAVLALFESDPKAAGVAVAQADGAPLGLVYRDVLLGMMQVAGPALADTPIRDVMDASPRIAAVDGDTALFVNQLADSDGPVFRTAFIAVDEAGGYAGVGGLTSLLASHRRKQREARESMALVERMAHDIGQHLEGVLAFTERLDQQRLSPDASAYVRAINDTSADMRDMLARAMDLHRSSLGSLPLSPKPHLLREVADAVEARWAAKASESGSTLLFSFDGDPECGALIDAERLMQVFDALIDNALANGRGVVEASLHVHDIDGVLKLDGSVRDNASGSPEERLARVFDPLGEGRMADRSEMALGVSIALAHQITRIMGGSLRAEANRGAGLTMSFSVNVQAARIGQAPAVEQFPHARPAHILIVDDNATNRMVAEALCEMFDCTSEQVVDGVEAVEAAGTGRFDLILMDIKMPRMDGVAATRAIRELGGPASLAPIVALTANADPADVQNYLAAGMQDVVEKPIKPERLAQVLNALLGDAREAAA